jgi:hypothetical protein
MKEKNIHKYASDSHHMRFSIKQKRVRRTSGYFGHHMYIQMKRHAIYDERRRPSALASGGSNSTYMLVVRAAPLAVFGKACVDDILAVVCFLRRRRLVKVASQVEIDGGNSGGGHVQRDSSYNGK